VAHNPPVEADPNCFNAIRAAVPKGIIVIEAAGNGGANLDNYAVAGKKILNPAEAGFIDSYAIIVGAGLDTVQKVTIGSRQVDVHRRTSESNFGKRIDCYAWGVNAITVGRFPFSGTSAASAIVAGAAIVVQGINKAMRSVPLTPSQMRQALKHGGTPSHPSDKIGVMPDLKKILSSAGPILKPKPEIPVTPQPPR
jgi:hypothetical protein